MIKIFDFDNIQGVEFGAGRFYAGKGGKKVSIKFNDEYYIIKKPNCLKDRNKKVFENIELSYNNSPISEYIGSHIYNIIGVKAHETFLGYYQNSLVVVCKDFRKQGEVLKEFSDIKVCFIGNDSNDDKTNGNGSHLSSILNVIRNERIFKKIDDDVELHFWKMFVIDFLIGNIDRNNGNWGILINENENKVRLTPVYDNGNCLNNLISDNQIEKLVTNKDFDIFIEKQFSFFVDDEDKPLKMDEVIKNYNAEKLKIAIMDIVPKIDIKTINEMIDEIPKEIVSEIRNQYYKVLIGERYEKILKPIYEKLLK